MKTVMLICAVLLATACVAQAGVPLKINNKEMQEGAFVPLFSDDLEGGKLTVATPAEEGIDGAEVSFDKGRTWEKMEREGGQFVFKYRPRDGEKMNIVFMFKKASGETAMRSTNVTVYYQKDKPDQAIMTVLQKMKDAYEAEQKGRFMDLFSLRFPSRVQFEESIQNDFYNYNNIRLYYRVDRAANDQNYQGAIWNVYWERKYMSRSGVEYSDNANIAMKFNKEADRWLVGAMNGNTIFGSSLLASPDLTVTSSGISGGYVGVNYVISAVIRNIGQAPATNVPVRFNYPTAPTPTGIETVAVINAGSSVTVDHSFGPIVPGAGDSVTITIDPNNTISEDNEGNNTATKNFPF